MYSMIKFEMVGSNCRQISQFARKLQQKQQELSDEKFTLIYKFPYIRALAIVNRLKLYQTALTAAAIPGTVFLNQLNIYGTDSVLFAGALGISGCLALYSVGYLCQNFVGIVYYNEAKDVAKIAYVDFWGRRKNVEVPAKDIVPFSDLPLNPLDGLFLQLRRFSTKDTLKMNVKHGEILDKKKFNQVFF